MTSATEMLDLADALNWAADDLPDDLAAVCRQAADELARHGTALIIAMMDAAVEKELSA